MDLPLPIDGVDVPLASSAQLRPAWLIALLALIDRTILPRRIAVTNGVAEVVLGVADAKARLLKPDASYAESESGSAEIAGRLAALCTPARPLTYSLAAWTPQGAPGCSIADLVNALGAASAAAQHREKGFRVGPGGFDFDAEGWPLAMPESAGAETLIAAWRLHLWMLNWKTRLRAALGGEMLLVATPYHGPHRWAIHASPAGAEISAVGQEELGKLVSHWRAQSTLR